MLKKIPKNVLVVLGLMAGLLVLIGVGYGTDNAFFTVQVSFILILACILMGGWIVMKLIQKL